MINQPELTLLEQLENAGVGVDVDDGDPAILARLPFVPHDVTSNQLVIGARIIAPENKELVEKTIRDFPGADWLDIHIILVSRHLSRVVSCLTRPDRPIPQAHD